MPRMYNRPLREYTFDELEVILDAVRTERDKLNHEERFVYQEMVNRTTDRPLYC